MPKTPVVEIFRLLPELYNIKDRDLRMSVAELIAKNSSYLSQPSSISGKHHKGETRLQHLQMAYRIIEYICEEFKITGDRRDTLIAAIILHDIGYVKSERPGKVKGWTYYDATGWSSKSYDDNIRHPIHGFDIIMASNISEKFKVDIANIILKHMSHWYNIDTPMPETEDEKFVAIADYISSKSGIIFVGLEAEDWRK